MLLTIQNTAQVTLATVVHQSRSMKGRESRQMLALGVNNWVRLRSSSAEAESCTAKPFREAVTSQADARIIVLDLSEVSEIREQRSKHACVFATIDIRPLDSAQAVRHFAVEQREL